MSEDPTLFVHVCAFPWNLLFGGLHAAGNPGLLVFEVGRSVGGFLPVATRKTFQVRTRYTYTLRSHGYDIIPLRSRLVDMYYN